jgi:DNA-binding CsgD family transcriptional regulator
MSFGRQQTWTSQEIETIRLMSQARRSAWDMAIELNRSSASVKTKLNRLGLSRWHRHIVPYVELEIRLVAFTCMDCGTNGTRERRVTKTGAAYGRVGLPKRCYRCKKKHDWAVQRARRGQKPWSSVWTEERKAQAKALWLEGKSASQVGKILELTKNQVIGFIHRAGLGRPRKVRNEGRRPHRASRPRKVSPPKMEAVALPIEPPTLFAPHECVPFMERKQSQCSQILYDKPTLCCPQPVIYRGVCAHHARVNYKFRNAKS